MTQTRQASVAAVVLGGVSLAGGKGGFVGPIIAVIILRLVRQDLTFLSVDANLAGVIEGAIIDSPSIVRMSSVRAQSVTFANVEGMIWPRTASTRLVCRIASSKLPTTSRSPR